MISVVTFMIGERIRNLRIDKGLKQNQLAEATGLSRISIGNYERGNRQPPVDVAAKIASALGVTVDYLLDNEHGMSLVTDRGATPGDMDVLIKVNRNNNEGYDLYYKIVQDVGTLPEEDQREVLALIEAKKHRLERALLVNQTTSP
jgi:transcriptional regulator with XRE-family HTH domain